MTWLSMQHLQNTRLLRGPAWRQFDRSKTLRGVFMAAVALMALTSVVLVYLLIQATDNQAMSEASFTRLLWLNAVTAFLLFGLIVFIAVRLMQRLKAKRFGSKLLLKLAAIFALVGVLPGLVIYGVSYQFVSRSIETWFDIKVERALEAGLNLGRSSLDSLTLEASQKTRQLVWMPADSEPAGVASALERVRQQIQADDVQLWSQSGIILGSSGDSRYEINPERPSAQILRRAKSSQLFSVIEGLDESNKDNLKGARIKIYRWLAPNGFDLMSEARLLVVVQKLPANIVSNALAVQSAFAEYQERALAREGLQKMYIGTLSLSLFLAVFGAILLAIVLGNQLISPLLILAKGVEEVAAGNLTPKIAIHKDDELSGLTRAFADMTTQLAQAKVLQEREQRLQAWSEVAQRVAHEIKNPLTPIQLSAERLIVKIKPKLEDADAQVLQRSVNTIIDQVDAMKRLVNEFRDFARLPAAQLQTLALDEVIQDTLLLYEAELAKGSIATIYDTNAPTMMGDAQQLRQLIHNLLQNALDASSTHAQPQVRLRTGWDAATGKLSFTIEDNGTGFTPEVLARAFEPYVTTKTKGTGLGLAVVYKIVQEHKGQITLGNLTSDQSVNAVTGAQINIQFPQIPKT